MTRKCKGDCSHIWGRIGIGISTVWKTECNVLQSSLIELIYNSITIQTKVHSKCIYVFRAARDPSPVTSSALQEDASACNPPPICIQTYRPFPCLVAFKLSRDRSQVLFTLVLECASNMASSKSQKLEDQGRNICVFESPD